MRRDQDIGSVLLASLAPPPDLGIADWARDNIVLGIKQPSNLRGPYRPEKTPYIMGVFEALRDHDIEQVTIQKGSQVGLSLAMHIAALYWCCTDPGPTLFVLPTEAMYRSVSETRLMPLIADSPAVAEEVLPGRDTMRIGRYSFRRCNLEFAAANSQVSLSSRSVRYLFLDETSAFPVDVADASSPVASAVERTKTFAGSRKIVLASTPRNESDYICTNFKDGDQRYFNLPCPACGREQVLKWERVRFDKNLQPEEAGAGAYYECESEACRHRWSDAEKVAALSKGRWIATNPSVKRHASFHLSSMYSPWVKWSGLVEQFLKKKDFTNELKAFINGELGEPWAEAEARTSVSMLDRATSSYARDAVLAPTDATPIRLPSGDEASVASIFSGKAVARFMSVDVQATEMWWVVRQWAMGGDSCLIAWGQAYDWYEVDGIARRYACNKVVVDASDGQRTTEICQACFNFQFFPAMGKANLGGHYSIGAINPFQGTRRQGDAESIPLILINPNISKSMLFDLLENRNPLRRWLVYAGIEEEYLRQMQAEVRVKGKWVQKKGMAGKANHLLDCESMNLALAVVCGFFEPPRPDPMNRSQPVPSAPSGGPVDKPSAPSAPKPAGDGGIGRALAEAFFST